MSQKSSPCTRCKEAIPYGKMKCPHCGLWQSAPVGELTFNDFDSLLMSQVSRADHDRLITGPWDIVWGGGMVKTSVTLFGGAPGAGKSTLLLQIADKCPGEPVYIAAEESLSEIALRYDRLKLKKDIRMVPALNGANVGAVLSQYKPSIVFIDSLQGLVGKDDSLQEEVCKICKINAVRLGCPVVLVSHVTKEEVLAGRMTLQHTVDVTMTFQDDGDVRLLSSIKNRFGPANVECYFEMTSKGLVHVKGNNDD